MKHKSIPQTLYRHITDLAASYPEKIAITSLDRKGDLLETISYHELKKRLEGAVSWLHAQHLKPGDVVGIAMHNSPDLLILSWAAWSIGVVTAPLDMKRDTLLQHKYKLTLCQANLLVTQKGIFSEEDMAAFSLPVKVWGEAEWGKTVPDDLWIKDGTSTALILFTSGTTSHPKGAQLSLRNLLVNAHAIRNWLKIVPSDTFLVNLPLHHINSTTFCLATLLAGGTIAIIPAYSNSLFWSEVAKSGATLTSIVQSICFDQLARQKEFAAVKAAIRLTRMQIGSAPVVVSDLKKFMQQYSIKLYQGYGQTETALRVTGVPIDLSADRYDQLVTENSIGVPMSWADLQILDKNGEKLAAGQEGELGVKGEAVMKGYLGEIEAFNQDGYFMTGDIGYFIEIDGRKFFYLKGRKKEIIIKGGINISPVAVENLLKQISSDIDQAYVVGVPDERYGEEVGAVICFREGVDIDRSMLSLKQSLLMRKDVLSAYETPQFLLSYKAEDLPMTSTGKIQRSVLREKIPRDAFSPITEVTATESLHFFILTPQSEYLEDAYKLFNRCWDPLTVTHQEYKEIVSTQTVVAAIRPDGSVAGTVAYVRTDLPEDILIKTPYSDFIDPKKGIQTKNGASLVCVAICSDSFKKQDVPQLDKHPTPQAVEEYLRTGRDGVFTFHQKAKGGGAGASLVSVIENGRPEDTSSLGYIMLLKYPDLKDPHLTKAASVSINLIEVVMLIGHVTGGKTIYALSRPGGLASYLAKNGR